MLVGLRKRAIGIGLTTKCSTKNNKKILAVSENGRRMC